MCTEIVAHCRLSHTQTGGMTGTGLCCGSLLHVGISTHLAEPSHAWAMMQSGGLVPQKQHTCHGIFATDHPWPDASEKQRCTQSAAGQSPILQSEKRVRSQLCKFQTCLNGTTVLPASTSLCIAKFLRTAWFECIILHTPDISSLWTAHDMRA